MSDFGAARLQRGESHPSKFRASRLTLETENRPSPPKRESESPRIDGEIHAAVAIAVGRTAVEDNFSLHAPRIEGIHTDAFVIQENPPQRRPSVSSRHRPRVPPFESLTINKTNKKQRQQETPFPHSRTITITRNPISPSMPPPTGPIRFFIASLGNPPPYHTTRHSAGHILLKSLQSHLSLPPLTKSKSYSGGHVSQGSESYTPQFTLWQSPSLMNTSGPLLLKAYKYFLSTIESESGVPALVILHDEMETSPSQFRLRRGPTSPKGHNGIKSVQSTFQSAGVMDSLSQGQRFIKVGVGIGRPSGGSRERDDVSAYVLGQLNSSEKAGIEGSVGQLVDLLEGEMGRISRGAS